MPLLFHLPPTEPGEFFSRAAYAGMTRPTCCGVPRSPTGRALSRWGSSHTLDQLDICFDDTHAVANAGLRLPATLAEQLGIQQATDQLIDLGERPGAAHPGLKLLTLVQSMLAGRDCIDDADLLRCGATSQVLGHRVMAAPLGWDPAAVRRLTTRALVYVWSTSHRSRAVRNGLQR
jgi:hypothetical protein